ncbi:MAG: CaiB/BaiF CoA-transferase family protein [Pseudomonadota bacterium]
MKDLEGLLVITVEHAVAAPYASGKLADAGARVIKVERPEGDFARGYDSHAKGGSAYFVWLNRGKKSVCLNLKSDDDKKILASMITKADVLIQNLGPGVMAKLGFDPIKLREQHPSLIVCSISGYGSEGPWSHQKAYDLLIQAESGLCAINGTAEGPARVGVSVCDIAAGMTAFQAILQALIARGRTGEGRLIEVSLFGAMADWMNVPYIQHRYGGATPTRQGLKHPTLAPYGAFDCADGKTILISIQNEREWQIFCTDVLGDPDLPTREGFSTNIERVANRSTVDRLCNDFFKQRDREANITLLAKAKIAYGRLSDLDDLTAHPQNRFIEVKTENGKLELLAPAAIIHGQTETYGPVPTKDEHGQTLRAEFGRCERRRGLA